jgi:hypothetical protein
MGTDVLFFLGFIILVAGSVIGATLHFRLITWLKNFQPETWKELGSPGLLSNSVREYSALRKFLANLESPRDSKDELAKRGRALRRFNAFYLPVCLATLVAMAYLLIRR